MAVYAVYFNLNMGPVHVVAISPKAESCHPSSVEYSNAMVILVGPEPSPTSEVAEEADKKSRYSVGLATTTLAAEGLGRGWLMKPQGSARLREYISTYVYMEPLSRVCEMKRGIGFAPACPVSRKFHAVRQGVGTLGQAGSKDYKACLLLVA